MNAADLVKPGERIAKVELTVFSFPMENVAAVPSTGDWIDQHGARSLRTRLAVAIETEDGSRGEYVGGADFMIGQARKVASRLIGFGWYERERLHAEMKRSLAKTDRTGVGVFDNAMWDLAGKRLGTSVSALLGGSRSRLPAYASTWMGGGGLSEPSDYVAFARECRSMGYRAFKMHGWSDGNVGREIRTVRALGTALGGEMTLMIDPGCTLHTFGDALALGRACDDAGFFWLEDPFADGGQSAHAHRRLRELISTPLLIGEHVRGLQSVANLVTAGGTDFVRADPDLDMGITGARKIAGFAEAMGLDVELHASGPAQRALMSAIRNTNFYEMSLVGPNRGHFTGHYHSGGYSDDLESIEPDGTVPVPDGPGLGVTYDWDFIAENAKDRAVFCIAGM
ncbi:MAG TPA: enolase C-terminal domain-like protein [Devosiaceae bacterium]